jgi:hypothetical protein
MVTRFHKDSWREEATGLRWFAEETRVCRMCGKPSQGKLYNYQNTSYGEH